jgi:hypothetical protein
VLRLLFILVIFSNKAIGMQDDLGLDFKVDNLSLYVFVNSVPYVDPEFDLGASASMQSSIGLKNLLYTGVNELAFKIVRVDLDREAEFKFLFRSWDSDVFNMPFEGDLRGFGFNFDFENPFDCRFESNSEEIEVLKDGCAVTEVDGGYLISFKFNLKYEDLYRAKYIDSAVPVNDVEGVDERILNELKLIYSMYNDNDYQGLEDYLSPSQKKYAEDYDVDLGKVFEATHGEYLKDKDFKVSDFDASASKLYITHDEKLVGIFDTPFELINPKTTESFMPVFFFWFDKNGHIHIKQ